MGLLSLLTSTASAGIYDTPLGNAVNWLLQQRNVVDGSWGSRDDLRYLQTSEAVLALAAANRKGPEYYAGLAWLQNHSADNVDYLARKIQALQVHGNDVSADLQRLQAAQRLAASDNGGFGLSKNYQGATMDSALVLQAYSQAAYSTNASNAINYLKTAQLTGLDTGWSLGQESSSDPVATAHVLMALMPYRASDTTLTTPVNNGLTALNSKVTTTSPVIHRALAAIANLRNSSTSTQAATLMTSLLSSQAADGSWGSDAYATALSIRAIAAAMGADLALLATPVAIPDQKLREAVNQALGRNSLDRLSRGDLANLTSLDISGRGITSLTGLEWASNLTSLNAANNSISSTAPLAGLTKLTQLYLGGNPVGPVAKLSVASLNFGAQRVSVSSAGQVLTLSNTGGAVLNISAISGSGDFLRSTACGTTLAAAASCSITQYFSPSALGPRSGSVSIASDGAASLSATLQGQGVRCATQDFNGDCKSDILMRQTTGNVGLWTMNANVQSANASLAMATSWVLQGAADLNGDRNADLIWRDPVSGQNYWWQMSGSTITAQGTLPAQTDTNWQIVGFGDLNGDGKDDIVWRHKTTGANQVWLMNGAALVSQLNLPAVTDLNWKIVAVGDLDGDGRADLVWRHAGTGQNQVYFMNGGTILSQAALATVADQTWQIVGIGDFDGNGRADLVWQQSSTSSTQIWLMNGATQSATQTPAVAAGWTVQAVADYNGDGKADLLLRQTSTGTLSQWLMNGAGQASTSTNWSLTSDWTIQR